MTNKLYSVAFFIFLFALLVFLGILFVPVRYDVPVFKARKGTRYWELASGSRIGYSFIPGKGIKKPFPVIYLHGGPGGSVSDAQISQLAPLAKEGYDLYFYDQIGSGHSARLKDIREYTASRHKEDLEEIIAKTGAEKVILIGQSWGALLATLLITDQPEKVEKAIFTGPGPVLPIRKELESIEAPDSLHIIPPFFSNRQGNQKAHNLRSRLLLRWALITGKKLAGDREADAFATYLKRELNKSITCDTAVVIPWRAGDGFYAQTMTYQSFFELEDRRSEIRKVKVPVLIMKGQCDNQAWGYTSEYMELFSNHRFELIPAAGHAIAFEQPERYLHTIRSFLSPNDSLQTY